MEVANTRHLGRQVFREKKRMAETIAAYSDVPWMIVAFSPTIPELVIPGEPEFLSPLLHVLVDPAHEMVGPHQVRAGLGHGGANVLVP